MAAPAPQGLRWLVSGLPGERRWAAWDAEGVACEAGVERADRPGAEGDLCLGRVSGLDRRLGAAFVDIGLARPGFLPLAGLEPAPGEGAALAVRVQRPATADKGVKLALAEGVPVPSGARPPALLDRRDALAGILMAGTAPPEAVLVDDAATLSALREALAARPEVADRLRPVQGAEAAALERALAELREALLSSRVALPEGGTLWIEPTRALVAVDVDRGGAGQAEALNEAAARTLARQIRLRGLSGVIAVDFLDPGGPEPRARLRGVMEAALAAEAPEVELGRLGGDGLALLTGRRRRPALHELLSLPADEGGWRRDPVALAYELLRRARVAPAAPRLTLAVSRAVARALKGPARPALDAVAALRGQGLELAEEAGRCDAQSELQL